MNGPDRSACGAAMYSGMPCALAPQHAGDHKDRFGLRDPKRVSVGATLREGDVVAFEGKAYRIDEVSPEESGITISYTAVEVFE